MFIPTVLIVVKNGKGAKDRVIPLVVESVLRLHNFIRYTQPDKRVFKHQATGNPAFILKTV